MSEKLHIKMLKMIHKFEYVLISLVIHDSKLISLGWDKTRHSGLHIGLWETVTDIFVDQMTNVHMGNCWVINYYVLYCDHKKTFAVCFCCTLYVPFLSLAHNRQSKCE